jgi:TRAP-type C4-dicarboxylate transport system substrate-binding protein
LKYWKFAEVAPYTYTNMGIAYANPFFVAMNKEKWNSLPKDIQQIIDTLNNEWAEKQAKLWDQVEKEGYDYAIQLGNKFTQATPAEEEQVRQRANAYLDEYVKSSREKGLPGDEVLKFVLEAVKTTPYK